jgi:hypothetical protein
MNTRTVDIEVKELPGTLSNMGNDTENEKNDSLCDTDCYHQYQSFHVFRVSPLIKLEPCFVPASIFKGLVCHVFIWCVLLNCDMRLLCLVLTLQNFLDLHTMTLRSVGGAATCVMLTNFQHHHTLLRNITC